MKNKLFIGIAMLSCQLIFGQEKTDSVRLISSKYLTHTETESGLQKKATSQEMKLLTAHLKDLGYKKVTRKESYFGSESVREIKSSKKRLNNFFYLQDYINDKNEYAAIGVSGCSLDGSSKEYAFLLLAPDGKFETAKDYFVEKGKIALAHSWKTCLQNHIAGCAGICITALVTCTGTLAAYFACLAASCGTCLAWELACCSCDCSWWCKGAVGCCNR
jgi:hypothetical protein